MRNELIDSTDQTNGQEQEVLDKVQEKMDIFARFKILSTIQPNDQNSFRTRQASLTLSATISEVSDVLANGNGLQGNLLEMEISSYHSAADYYTEKGYLHAVYEAGKEALKLELLKKSLQS